MRNLFILTQMFLRKRVTNHLFYQKKENHCLTNSHWVYCVNTHDRFLSAWIVVGVDPPKWSHMSGTVRERKRPALPLCQPRETLSWAWAIKRLQPNAVTQRGHVISANKLVQNYSAVEISLPEIKKQQEKIFVHLLLEKWIIFMTWLNTYSMVVKCNGWRQMWYW